jgi:hypothetical protein
MASETPAPAGAQPLRRLRARAMRFTLSAIPYVLVALALLAASEVLWLWHSWPLRELLATEQADAGGLR